MAYLGRLRERTPHATLDRQRAAEQGERKRNRDVNHKRNLDAKHGQRGRDLSVLSPRSAARVLKNRESAARSKLRRKARIEMLQVRKTELEEQLAALRKESAAVGGRVELLHRQRSITALV